MQRKGEGNLRTVEFVLLNEKVFNDFADAAGSILQPATSAEQEPQAYETLGSPGGPKRKREDNPAEQPDASEENKRAKLQGVAEFPAQFS